MILIIKKTGKAIREMVYLVIRSAVPPELSLSRCFSFLLLLIVSARDIKGGGLSRSHSGEKKSFKAAVPTVYAMAMSGIRGAVRQKSGKRIFANAVFWKLLSRSRQ